MSDSLGVTHHETVRVTPGATVDTFAAWLKTLPGGARISVTHTSSDRNMGHEYSISASWATSVREKEI